MYQTIDVSRGTTPANTAPLSMGVGFPADLVAAVERGVDLFDCVAPTRGGRNGSAYPHREGTLNIRNAAPDRRRAMDPSCDCETCTTYSRATCGHLLSRASFSAAVVCRAQCSLSDPPPAEMRAVIQRGGDAFATLGRRLAPAATNTRESQ